MKSAVLYYSRTQKTAVTANALAEKTSGDLIEIIDLKNRKGIFGWLRAAMDARGNKTTQIEPSTVDTANYDTMYIGTPVWAGNPTPAFNTIIKNFEITGKDIVIFLTCGSNYGNALDLMSEAVKSEGGNVIQTIAITNTGKKSDEDIKNEINNIEIPI
ncbi:MAG: flavodoxin family protein [Methanobacterium sp.]